LTAAISIQQNHLHIKQSRGENMILKIIVSLSALVGILIHAIFPNFRIDIITIGLFLIGIIPWLSSLIDSFELPGGWKLKFAQLEETRKRAEKVGLISGDTTKNDSKPYTFQMIGNNDPNLALAGLRIEIERRLIQLAENNNIGTNMQGAGRLLQMLSGRDLVGNEEKSVLIDMITLLNSAVHGARIDARSYSWAMQYGPEILNSLDEKIKKHPGILSRPQVKRAKKKTR
jgi:hypothetical protein